VSGPASSEPSGARRERAQLSTAPAAGGRSRADLDGLVIGVELTLLSVVAGVVLGFLIGASSEALVTLRLALWPYLATGLVLVFLFWSRAVIHTFTLIRWPIEYGHNFLYIGCSLLQAVMLTQVGRPVYWFATGTAVSAAFWLLFAYDLKLIRHRREGANGPAGIELLDRIHTEQLVNVRVAMPLAVVFHMACALAIRLAPGALGARGAVALVVVQLAAGVAYQAYVLRWFRGIAPLVPRCREEWRTMAEGAAP
jgi:hypothetical protein